MVGSFVCPDGSVRGGSKPGREGYIALPRRVVLSDSMAKDAINLLNDGGLPVGSTADGVF